MLLSSKLLKLNGNFCFQPIHSYIKAIMALIYHCILIDIKKMAYKWKSFLIFNQQHVLRGEQRSLYKLNNCEYFNTII